MITCISLDLMKINFLTKRNKLQKYSQPIITILNHSPSPRQLRTFRPVEVYFSFCSFCHISVFINPCRPESSQLHRSSLCSDLFRLISCLVSSGSQSNLLLEPFVPLKPLFTPLFIVVNM